MENAHPNSVDIQNWVDNFEAIIKSGDVRLVAQNGEMKLYQDSNGVEYIYNGHEAYSQISDEFAEVKARYFQEENT